MSGLSKTDADKLQALLVQLNLMPSEPNKQTEADKGAFAKTDPEFQILKAGATALSTWITKAITAAGGLSAVWAAVEAYLSKADPPLQVALVASAALIVSVAALSLALLIGADVKARATATAAQYQARGQVAAALEAAAASPQGTGTDTGGAASAGQATNLTIPSNDLSISLLAVSCSGRKVQARLKDNDQLGYVTGVRYQSGNLRLRLSEEADAAAPDDSWHGLSDIDEFTAGP